MGGEIASLVRPVRPPCVLPERKNIAARGGLKKIRVFDSFFSPLETQRNNFASKFGSNQEGEKDILIALYSLHTEGDERRKQVDLASCIGNTV